MGGKCPYICCFVGCGMSGIHLFYTPPPSYPQIEGQKVKKMFRDLLVFLRQFLVLGFSISSAYNLEQGKLKWRLC